MDLANLVVFLLVGAVAGWLAGVMMKGRGFGLVRDIIIGIIGGFIGGYLFDLLNISLGTGIISAIMTAAIGAILLLFTIGLLRRR